MTPTGVYVDVRGRGREGTCYMECRYEVFVQAYIAVVWRQYLSIARRGKVEV